MGQSVELRPAQDGGSQPVTVNEVQRLIERSREQSSDGFRPINIQINLNDERKRSEREDHSGFRLRNSKLLWLVVVLAVGVGSAYIRTRYVCQNFRDQGRFFYGMDVSRCVGILIKEPLAQVSDQLAVLNRHY